MTWVEFCYCCCCCCFDLIPSLGLNPQMKKKIQRVAIFTFPCTCPPSPVWSASSSPWPSTCCPHQIFLAHLSKTHFEPINRNSLGRQTGHQENSRNLNLICHVSQQKNKRHATSQLAGIASSISAQRCPLGLAAPAFVQKPAPTSRVGCLGQELEEERKPLVP